MNRARMFATQGENRLLESLSSGARDALARGAKKTSLGIRDQVFKTDDAITHVYFPLSGVISLVIRMSDGPVVEVATIGNEGFVGTSVVLGVERSPTEAFCQVPGQALVLPVEAFKHALSAHAELSDLALRYTQALIAQISQSTACNHLHSVQERMCRWLLMTHDRVDGEELQLTQDFLSQMLGVRRPSVTVVAGMLQQAGLIDYRRGRIKVLDREGLEKGSCECYHVMRREYDRLFGQ
jgi:CRP-like cAMP-binding protein